MGKTAVELPHPPDQGVKTGSGSADDLLAQMAGEEIDRLLSEAGAHADSPEPSPAPPPAQIAAPAEPPATPPAPPDPAPTAGVSQSDPSQPLEDLMAQLAEEDNGTTESAESAVEPATAAEISQVIVPPIAVPKPKAPAEKAAPVGPAPQAKPPPAPPIEAPLIQPDAEVPAPPAEPPAAKPPPAPPPPAAAPPPADAPAALAAQVVAQPEVATTLIEPSMLDLADDAAPAKSAHHLPKLDPLAWSIKLLEWINAPMKACPDGLRNAIGYISLLTLFNAAAVLLYIFFFRRPPHP